LKHQRSLPLNAEVKCQIVQRTENRHTEASARFSHKALKSTTELRRLQISHQSKQRSSGERKPAQNTEAPMKINYCVYSIKKIQELSYNNSSGSRQVQRAETFLRKMMNVAINWSLASAILGFKGLKGPENLLQSQFKWQIIQNCKKLLKNL
jgi:hypothetical protein